MGVVKVKDSDVKYRWISNYYDCPLEGTCYYMGILFYFKRSEPIGDDYDFPDTLELTELGTIGSLKWKWKQWRFEQCVGSHWSNYPYKRNSKLKPDWLRNIYYKIK